MSFAFNSSTAHAATVIFVLRLIGFSVNRMEALLMFRILLVGFLRFRFTSGHSIRFPRDAKIIISVFLFFSRKIVERFCASDSEFTKTKENVL
jgi:hypothetical protein